MTKFETFLISKGAKKFTYNPNTRQYNETEKHVLSSMVNLDHRYFLNGHEIVFGLHEANKPPTLIYPRPKINIKTNSGFITEESDDAMNIVLNKETPEDILMAIFDDNIVFEYDLTK